MLTSQLGIRLILLVGGTIPLPASYDLMTALTHVEVTNDADQSDGFQLTFALSKDSLMGYSILSGGSLDPFNRVVIGVLLGITPEVLINGVITHHQFSPSNDPGMSTLTVMGKDVTAMLDLKEANQPYKNQPDFVIVNRILATYAQYGLVPPYQVTPTTDIPIELQRIPRRIHRRFVPAQNGGPTYILWQAQQLRETVKHFTSLVSVCPLQQVPQC